MCWSRSRGGGRRDGADGVGGRATARSSLTRSRFRSGEPWSSRHMWRWGCTGGGVDLTAGSARYSWGTDSCMPRRRSMRRERRAAYTLGMVLWAVYVVYTAYLLLSYPGGRLESRLERAFIRAYALSTAVLWSLVLALSPTFPGAGSFNDCGTRCPPNALVGGDAAIGTALNTAASIVFTIALIGLTMLLFDKARAPGPVVRRALTPVTAVFTATVAWFVISLYVLPAYPETASVVDDRQWCAGTGDSDGNSPRPGLGGPVCGEERWTDRGAREREAADCRGRADGDRRGAWGFDHRARPVGARAHRLRRRGRRAARASTRPAGARRHHITTAPARSPL